jgi:chromosome segregation and condensation protein ScpB
MMLVAFQISDAATLAGIVGAILLVALAGLPWRLIQTLRTEREELERLLRERTEEVHGKDGELTELRAKTDLSTFASKLDTIESGMSGAFAGLAVEHREMIKALGQISATLAALATFQKGAP